MTARSQQRGHSIEFDGERWVYSDDKTPADIERPCKRCGRYPTPDGHDACLGSLQGVKSACCGHGIKPPYIIKEDKENGKE